MTMHLNETLLASVMANHGGVSKTGAVDFAFRELDPRRRLRTFLKRGVGLSEKEIRNSVDPDSDSMALRVAEERGKSETPDPGLFSGFDLHCIGRLDLNLIARDLHLHLSERGRVGGLIIPAGLSGIDPDGLATRFYDR